MSVKLILMAGAVACALPLWAKVDRKSPAEPVRLIIDTDMYTDIDSGAVAIAHVLADAGECELIGVISCAGGSAVSVPMIELVNAVYGRPELPVGAPKDWVIAPEKDPERKGLDAHPERFPHYEQMRRAIRANPGLVRHARSDEAPDAVAVYRRLLAAQPDASVTICTIGWLTNMRQLLASRPDAISPLSGRDLVARKVRLLFSMACAFPDGREYNAWRDTISTAIVLYDWPGPIHFVDYNYGFGMKCGMPLARRPPSMNNPVQEIYRDTIQRNVCGKKGGHPAWDEVTVLFAVRGWEPYCHGVRGRFDIVNNRGDNRWTPDPNGPHVVVREKMPRKEVCAIIDELLTRAPKRGLAAAE